MTKIIQAEIVGEEIHTMEEIGKDKEGLSGIKDKVYKEGDEGYEAALAFVNSQGQENS